MKLIIPKRVTIVPKFETAKGIENFAEIILNAETDTAMLDKEDLYRSVKHDNERFTKLVTLVRKKARSGFDAVQGQY